MTQIDEVISDMELQVMWIKDHPTHQFPGWMNTVQAMQKAIALLKAQEPVEPTEPDEDNTQYCRACGSGVGYEVLEPSGIGYIKYNYCPMCGKAVKWDG